MYSTITGCLRFTSSGTSPLINIEDILQRMHQIEQVGQVCSLHSLVRPTQASTLLRVETSIVTVSTYFNTDDICELVDAVDFLLTERKLLQTVG